MKRVFDAEQIPITHPIAFEIQMKLIDKMCDVMGKIPKHKMPNLADYGRKVRTTI